MKNTAIKLSGHIIKENEQPFSEQEYEDFFDAVLALIEHKELQFYGYANLVDAEVGDESDS